MIRVAPSSAPGALAKSSWPSPMLVPRHEVIDGDAEFSRLEKSTAEADRCISLQKMWASGCQAMEG